MLFLVGFLGRQRCSVQISSMWLMCDTSIWCVHMSNANDMPVGEKEQQWTTFSMVLVELGRFLFDDL
jgi:hypothetical protein